MLKGAMIKVLFLWWKMASNAITVFPEPGKAKRP
jgi:hypothetical protein